MIAIVNYGLGNVRAFANIYKRLGVPYVLASDCETLKQATHLILPGVGSFDYAMQKLNESGMREVLDDLVINQKRPVLGICVGMQIMATSSEEGNSEGLGWLDAEVVKFSNTDTKFPLPHMGWNSLELVEACPLFKNIESRPSFYFLHSFHFKPDFNYTVAKSKYSNEIACIVQKENVFGIQCHPEKSHLSGVTLLKNFYEATNA
ncbi:imidazole glycerol phosphate synthase, glutamine amidotransferase subunit [Enterovibrio norvegicus]|uniref:imidazole glycerol phosphate synthase subunit HisH n=1 Tax=Enterovibrio norvegicus TaxID=188144 RepID=UPI000C85BAAA|nr:imidazole glycerol phosphate synthase subunit HisH [Enterovibrio norvegicus]MCC4797873.1 imidazole glycerol phosphate synthase subunit HisH [Enterovibrio norvegicus]PMI33014.1 imidazole glycerol phosphate synthase, glutamine amidotransferase subunit [Enterovibrio norvegicus]PMI34876.1 imidazole glycerol phosphate synthase, glutamine amidotransferase subunit [Enterovibrio norvegicus]PMN45083.1 imidazole glycerol phosphate synthase, glutamine amidotransferase subunit [Enterovibrio norvegicus]